MLLCTTEQQDKFIAANTAALLSSIQTTQVCEDKYTQLGFFLQFTSENNLKFLDQKTL